MGDRGFFSNAAARTILEMRQGGPGNPWVILSTQAGMAALSGGRRGLESRWARGISGQPEPLGTAYTGNPERVTTTIDALIKPALFPDGLLGDLDEAIILPCDYNFKDVRVRGKCGDPLDRTDYQYITALINLDSTSTGNDNPLADATTGVDQDVKFTEALSALYAQNYAHIAPFNYRSNANSDFAFQKVRYIGGKEWWAVTVQDTTPGYSGSPASNFFWTTDNGLTWSSSAINALLEADITDVIRAGENIVVITNQNGAAYARIADVKAAVENPWVFVSISGTSTAITNAVVEKSDTGVLYMTNGLALHSSNDNGLSWSIGVVMAETRPQSIAIYNDDLIWVVSENPTRDERYLYRITNGQTATLVKMWTDTQMVGGNLIVRTPPQRPDEVYVGTDAGEIFRATNARATSPTFTKQSFPQANSGVINDIQFIGFRGDVMLVAQQDNAQKTRLLRDFSGGNFGNDVEVVASFVDMPDGELKSIAAATPNFVMAVGVLGTDTDANVIRFAAHVDR